MQPRKWYGIVVTEAKGERTKSYEVQSMYSTMSLALIRAMGMMNDKQSQEEKKGNTLVIEWFTYEKLIARIENNNFEMAGHYTLEIAVID